MKKKLALFLAFVMALSLAVPMMRQASAAGVTYCLEVSIKGKGKYGPDTERIYTSGYKTANDTLWFEVMTLYTTYKEDLRDYFRGTNLDEELDEAKEKYNAGGATWTDYVDARFAEVTQLGGHTVTVNELKDKSLKLGALAVNEKNTYQYSGGLLNGTYILTITLRVANLDEDGKFVTTVEPGKVTVTNRDTNATTVTETRKDGDTTTEIITDTDRHGNVSTIVSVTVKDGDEEVTTVTTTNTQGKKEVLVKEVTKKDDGSTEEKVYQGGELKEINTTTEKNGEKTTVKTDPTGKEISTTKVVKNGAKTTETVTTPAGDKTVTVSVYDENHQTIDQVQNLANGMVVHASVSSDRDAVCSIKVTDEALKEAVGAGYGGKIMVKFPAGDGNLVIETLPSGKDHPVEYGVVESGCAYVLVDRDNDLRIEYKVDLFADMTGSWAQYATDFTGGRQIFKGTAPGYFNGPMKLNRAMMVTVLYRLESEPENSGEYLFRDIQSNSWYEDAVAWGYETGVVKGYSSTKFAPADPITREQMAAMLYRYAKFHGYELSGTDVHQFSDADQISDYAREAVSWAVAKGLLEGYKGMLRPTAGTSRAEAAVIMQRFIVNVLTTSKQ